MAGGRVKTQKASRKAEALGPHRQQNRTHVTFHETLEQNMSPIHCFAWGAEPFTSLLALITKYSLTPFQTAPHNRIAQTRHSRCLLRTPQAGSARSTVR